MKKRFFFVAAAALALLATACSKDNDEAASQTEVRSIPITLTANYGNGSKVTYADDGSGNVTSTWESGDKIIVCYDGDTSELNISGGIGTTQATFTGAVKYRTGHEPKATTMLVCYVKDANVTHSEVTVDGTGTYHYTDDAFKSQLGTLASAAKLNLYYGAAFYGNGNITCNFSVNTSLMKFTLTNIGGDQGRPATLAYMSDGTEMASASFTVTSGDNTVWLSIPAGAYSGVQKLVYTCGGNTKEHVLSDDHANFVAGKTYSKSVGVINPPMVTTGTAVAMSSTRATGEVTLTDAGSETVTEIGICWGASDNPVVGSGNFAADGSYTLNSPSLINITGLTANSTYYVRGYAKVGDDYYYAASSVYFVTFAAPTVPTGAINGLFSVGPTNQVYFSKGNLQYNKSTQQFSFMDNQWSTFETNGMNIGSNYANQNIVSLFGWGAWRTGRNPLNTSNSGYQWGNGEPIAGWRTLTKDEWVYLIDDRTTPSGVLYAKATVNGVNGLIILPDDWSTTYYTLNSTNTANVNYTTNTISSGDWTSSLEAHGAVFLPAAGYRFGTTVGSVGTEGNYWSSLAYSTSIAFLMNFEIGDVNPKGANNYSSGMSVRLVKDL